jgi:polysaccharide export outer membrane protein
MNRHICWTMVIALAMAAAGDLVAERPSGAQTPVGYSASNSGTSPYAIGMLGPATPYPIKAVDCATGCAIGQNWCNVPPTMAWQPYGQGEYTGHDRLPHVSEYRLRVDDQLEFIYRLTREETPDPYRFSVGDELKIESSTDDTLDRKLIVQPDGTITLKLLGQMSALRLTVDQLRGEIEKAYKVYYRTPDITVTPVRVNAKLEDLRATVDKRFGFGGQSRDATITPEGTISLPAIGSVQAQGLTLMELKRELDERYAQEVEGLEVTPVLLKRAPRYVYVVGMVHTPGRYELRGPTTLTQTIALAEGWNVGANLRQVVVFRRGDDWRLLAAMFDIRGALYGKTKCPADEIWISDSDVVVVPKAPIRVFDDYVQLVFTQGLYGVMPFSAGLFFSSLAPLSGVAPTTASSTTTPTTTGS